MSPFQWNAGAIRAFAMCTLALVMAFATQAQAQVTYPLNQQNPAGMTVNSGVTNAIRGWKFRCNGNGVRVTRLGCNLPNGSSNQKTVLLWDDSTRQIIAQAQPATGSGWIWADLQTPVALTNGGTYIIVVFTPSQYYYQSGMSSSWFPTGTIQHMNEMNYTNNANAQTYPNYTISGSNYHYGVVDFGYIQGQLVTASASAGTAQDVYADAQGANNSGVLAGSFDLTNAAGGSATVESIKIKHEGTADASTDIQELAIYRDADGNNQFDSANDVLVGTGSAFTAPDGESTVMVTGSEQDFSASQAKEYFVVVKLNGMAEPGETFKFQVSDLGVGQNTIAGGVPTTTMEGLAVLAPDLEVMDASNPNLADAILGTNDNELMSFTLGYPNGPDNTISTIRVQASGSGDDATDYSALKLWLDDGDGSFDPNADTEIATSAFTVDDGTLDFNLSGANATIRAGTSRQYFITGDFPAGGGASAAHGDTFAVQLIEIDGLLTGTNVVTLPVPAGGPSAGVTILGNVLQAIHHDSGNQGPTLVDNDASGDAGVGVVLLDFTLRATNASWDIQGLIFEASGSMDDATAFSELALWEDVDGNGAFSAAQDAQTGTSGTSFNMDDGTWESDLITSAVTSAALRRFYLLGTLAGTASVGQDFQVRLLDVNATPPMNGLLAGFPTPVGDTYEIDAASFDVTLNGPMAATSVNNTAAAQVLYDVTLATKNDQFTVTDLTFTASGTGDDASAFSELSLFEDDGSGSFEFANDTLATSISGTAFSADNGEYVATLVDSNFDGPSSRRFFLVAWLNGSALSAETFNCALTQVASSSTSSTLPTPVPTMASTALLINNPVLSVANAGDAPGASVIEKTGEGFTHMLAKYVMTASNGDIVVNGVTISLTGTADWATSVTMGNGVQLYLDDGDQSFDESSDTLVSEISGAQGPQRFNFSNALMINNGESATLFLRVHVLGEVGASTPTTFAASIILPGGVSVPTGINVISGTPAPNSAVLTVIDFAVESFEPLVVAPGTFDQSITIRGSGFAAPVSLTIGGVPAGGAGQVSPIGDEITGFTVPEHEGAGLEIVLDTGLLPPKTLNVTFSYASPSSGGGGGCSLDQRSNGFGWIWIALMMVTGLGFVTARVHFLGATQEHAR